jgi:protein ImuB
LFLPSFPTDRLRALRRSGVPPVGVPFVTAGRDGSRRILCAVDAAARKAGLHVGMPVAEAQALLPGLALIEAEPDRDREALDTLAVQVLRRYSPIVALDAPDGLWIDTTGCDHLFGSETAMLADLRHCLHAAGYACRVALAGTTGAAHALARFGRSAVTIIPPGGEGAAVGALPLAALRLPEDVVAGLRRLGFDTIGQLAAVPRAPLVRRFGMEITRRLDQVSGAAAEPLDPIEPPDMPRVKLGFIEPIGTPEHLARAIADLADMLCVRLGDEGLGARRLDLAFARIDGRTEIIRAGTAAPNREPRHLVRLLIERLGTVDPGFGVETMTLSAPLAEPLDTRQIAAGFADVAGGDIALLVDTLANRLGAHRLYRAAPVESDIPERAVRTVAPLAPTLGAVWPTELPRPVRLLDPPEEVQTLAELPDHPPRQFIWRGRRHPVRHADGPERVFGEWWRREAETTAVRDYFAVEDEAGTRFWLFRSGDGSDRETGSYRWFLHGLFT